MSCVRRVQKMVGSVVETFPGVPLGIIADVNRMSDEVDNIKYQISKLSLLQNCAYVGQIAQVSE